MKRKIGEKNNGLRLLRVFVVITCMVFGLYTSFLIRAAKTSPQIIVPRTGMIDEGTASPDEDEDEPSNEESGENEASLPEKQAQVEEPQLKLLAEKAVILERRNIAEYIDLQGVVETWARNIAGQVAVEIYDMNYGQVAASYNAYATMRPKSLYKLFYTYGGYARLDAGLDDGNQIYAGNSTLENCLDLMIRNSDNVCAEKMLDDPVRAAGVGQLVTDLGLGQTAPDGLLTSAHDIVRLLQNYVAHPSWSNVSWSKFLSSALYQPAHLRAGLPAGLKSATVYNKVGFGPGTSGYIYNDAAIVDFAGGRRYIVVAMTQGGTSTNLRTLGAMLERAIIYAN